MERIIFHIDMDSFFTAVEQHIRPEIKNKPVVVGALPKGGKGRGVVSTASYEARKYGIHSGMPISKAYKLNPNCIFLPVNMPLYDKVSNTIMHILRKYSNKFEQVSIDEAYLDVTGLVKDFLQAEQLAKKIKQEIFYKEGLTCSIGIAPNKFLAKIASKQNKPDGLFIVAPDKIKEFLSPLPVTSLHGVGFKTAQYLSRVGIHTVADLQHLSKDKLRNMFGSKFANELYNISHGIDDSEVKEISVVKSISREHTFDVDTNNVRLLFYVLNKLAKEVYAETQVIQVYFKTVILKIRFIDFETHTTSKTLTEYISTFDHMLAITRIILKKYLPLKKKVRLIGIGISNFIPKTVHQLDLFPTHFFSKKKVY